MTNDSTAADQPTPAGSATRDSVQDVIARAIFEFDVPDVDPNVEAHALSIRIQESLAAAGYRIAAALPEWLKNAPLDPWTVRSEQRRDRVVLDDAAASEPAASGGA